MRLDDMNPIDRVPARRSQSIDFAPADLDRSTFPECPFKTEPSEKRRENPSLPSTDSGQARGTYDLPNAAAAESKLPPLSLYRGSDSASKYEPSRHSSDFGPLPALPHLAVGTLGIALPALADRALLNLPTEKITGLYKWWEGKSPAITAYDALMKKINDETAVHLTHAQNSKAIVDALRGTAEVHDKMLTSSDELIKKMKPNTAGHNLLQGRLDFLTDRAKIVDHKSIAEVIGSRKEVLGGSKLFIEGSAEAEAVKRFATLWGAKEHSVKALELSGEKLKLYKPELNKAIDDIEARVPAKLKSGLLFSGGSIVAGYTADGFLGELFGYKPKLDSVPRLFLDGVVTPIVLATPIAGRFKAAAAITSALTARFAAATGGRVGEER